MTSIDPTDLPLLVDLDGTLLQTDTLWESLLQLCSTKPLGLVPVLLALVTGGKAAMKARLSRLVRLPVELLPLREDFVEFLRQEAARGRRLYLVTGANQGIGQAVAEHLGIFAGVFGSDDAVNLTGSSKAAFAVERFGLRGFHYAGNDRVDLQVWSQSAGAVPVSVPAAVRGALGSLGIPMVREFAARKPGWRAVVAALRPHQWAKNALIFVPLILAHRFLDWTAVAPAIVGAVCFSLLSSALYIQNDLLDLAVDRAHPRKRTRPFASGALSIPSGLLLVGALLLAVLALLTLLSMPGVVWLGLYAVATTAYSLRLKTFLAVDVVVLTSFYTVRLLFGGAVCGIEISVWTIAFSLFFFMALAFVKRLSELDSMVDRTAWELQRRPYRATDRSVLLVQAGASAYSGLVVFCLYIHSPEMHAHYSQPRVLWLILPVLAYWLSRFLLMAHRGELHHDPVVFALKDRASWIVLGLLLSITLLAK